MLHMCCFLFLSLLNLYIVLLLCSRLALSRGTPYGNLLRIFEMIIFDFKTKIHSKRVKTSIFTCTLQSKRKDTLHGDHASLSVT
jgi:hypothetical protein